MQYPHRRNCDGSVDSICPRCIATIASSSRETDLEFSEAAHVCEPWRLDYFGATEGPVITWFKKPIQYDRASA